MSNPRRVWPLRDLTADAAIAVGVAVAVIVGTLAAVREGGDAGSLDLGDWLLIAVAGGAVVLRRRYPVAVAVLTLIISGLYYRFSAVDGPIMLTFVIALYTVAAEGQIIAAAGLGAAAILGVVYGEIARGSGRNLDNLAIFLLVGWLVAVIAVGGVTYNRRAYLREADRRAAAAEHGREEEALRRATEERLRIARELHDVLGHNISLINVQASAALHGIGRNPGQAEEALSAIKLSSKEALRELRATLGVLRQVDEAAPVSPAPSLARLGDLVDRATAMGLAVRTETEGGPRPLPSEVDLAAYRIVQEALTNVSRHAGSADAVVRIHYTDDDVRVQIDDDGPGVAAAGNSGASGNGIRGMTERARALGGVLAAGRRPDGGFRVTARLPLRGVS